MNSALSLPRPLVNRMLAHAQQNSEQEICGLIIQAADQSMRYLAIDNRAADCQQHYQMDTQQLIDSLRQLRESDEQLVAIVYSHPGAPAQVSALDIEQTGYPDACYLIISLNTRGVLEMRAWRIRDSAATEVRVFI